MINFRLADTGLVGSGTVTLRLAKYSMIRDRPGFKVCDTAGLENGPLQPHERGHLGSLLDGRLNDGDDITSRAYQVCNIYTAF